MLTHHRYYQLLTISPILSMLMQPYGSGFGGKKERGMVEKREGRCAGRPNGGTTMISAGSSLLVLQKGALGAVLHLSPLTWVQLCCFVLVCFCSGEVFGFVVCVFVHCTWVFCMAFAWGQYRASSCLSQTMV